ncbi:ATPase, partial [Nocardia asteroides]
MTTPPHATVQRSDAVLRELGRVVVGKRDELQLIMIAVL